MSTCATQHTAVWTGPPSLKQMPPGRLKAITEGGDPLEFREGEVTKYDPLRDYLAALAEDLRELTMSFGEIEELVGQLPRPACSRHAWWANTDDARVEARAWRAAGWYVLSADQTAEQVTFARRVTESSSFGYLIAWAGEGDDDDEQIPLCRIEYLGDDDEWGFAFYAPATESYAPAMLRTGAPSSRRRHRPCPGQLCRPQPSKGSRQGRRASTRTARARC